ncbi:MAG: GNAT family N-acetyltransferase, partial [Pseudomonadota bacterium]
MTLATTIETVAFDALSDDRIAQWSALRDQNPALESPYCHPDYHKLVHEHQGDVKVSMATHEGEILALLPWQGGGFARPSGAPLSDYQAITKAPNTSFETEDVLKGQSVGAFHYTAMSDPDGEPTTRLEISDAKQWRSERDGSYRRHLKSTRRRVRKAEEEFGPRRVVTCSRDIDAYQALMRWKREKFQETGKYDVLKNKGNSGLLRALWERGPEAELRADLHALYFGDKLAACDLGLTDGHVFHSWIVGYDPELLSYAPGIQLLEGLIDAAPSIGYGVIDLGPGTDGYKRHYATHPRYVS